MAGVTVSADQAAAELQKQFSEFTEDLQSRIRRDVDEVAKETAQKINNAAPGRGKYHRSWKVDTTIDSADNYEVSVHSRAPSYSLAHLMENPHALRNGKQTNPAAGFGGKVHIKPAEDWAIDELVDKITEEVNKG